jgi:hypothetical protein
MQYSIVENRKRWNEHGPSQYFQYLVGVIKERRIQHRARARKKSRYGTVPMGIVRKHYETSKYRYSTFMSGIGQRGTIQRRHRTPQLPLWPTHCSLLVVSFSCTVA